MTRALTGSGGCDLSTGSGSGTSVGSSGGAVKRRCRNGWGDYQVNEASLSCGNEDVREWRGYVDYSSDSRGFL